MLLPFEVYNPVWKDQFEIIKQGLNEILSELRVSIEHIGSTSVEGLSAKPIIDIMVGMNRESDLDEVPPLLMDKGYIYYEMYNITMPYRRFFVLLTNRLLNSKLPSQIRQGNEIPELLQDHTLRRAHIHVLPRNSPHWQRHIAFRDYLQTYPTVKEEYQVLKEKLTKQVWRDGNEYNEAKNAFIKVVERQALKWQSTQPK